MFQRQIANSFIVALLLSAPLFGSLENSVLPLINKFESPENLPVHKFSERQYSEITRATRHKEDRVRLLSYNVLFNLYDYKLDEVNRWPQRLPRIVELIDEMQPDIIAVQELYKSQLDLKIGRRSGERVA